MKTDTNDEGWKLFKQGIALTIKLELAFSELYNLIQKAHESNPALLIEQAAGRDIYIKVPQSTLRMMEETHEALEQTRKMIEIHNEQPIR